MKTCQNFFNYLPLFKQNFLFSLLCCFFLTLLGCNPAEKTRRKREVRRLPLAFMKEQWQLRACLRR